MIFQMIHHGERSVTGYRESLRRLGDTPREEMPEEKIRHFLLWLRRKIVVS